MIPYFAPLSVGIGSYLRTERKLISAAHKTLEELQSRFFTIQAILLRHRLRAEAGGVQESVLQQTHQYKELTVYNHDYDAKRRFELSKIWARNSYLMALVSRTVTDLHILTRIWDYAKEQLVQYQNNEIAMHNQGRGFRCKCTTYPPFPIPGHGADNTEPINCTRFPSPWRPPPSKGQCQGLLRSRRASKYGPPTPHYGFPTPTTDLWAIFLTIYPTIRPHIIFILVITRPSI